jgi:protein-tyrosine phosphatase
VEEVNANQVSKNLWVGGVPTDPKSVEKKFDVLVLCAHEFQDVFPPHVHMKTEVLLAPMDDGKITNEEKHLALKMALKIRERLDKGKKVLVTCAAGVNRSALVAGLAMMLGDHDVKSAIEDIRKHRKPQYTRLTPLSNPHFQSFMHEVQEAINTHTQKSHASAEAESPTAEPQSVA